MVACVDVDGDHVAVLTGRRNRLDLVGADEGLRVGLQNGPGDADAVGEDALEVTVADGVLDGDGPAAGLAGMLPQAASMAGTAIASVTPATVVRIDFMAASSARHGRASDSALTI